MFDSCLLSRVLSAGLRVVLNNLSEQLRECLHHSVDCAREAAAQADPTTIGALEFFGFLAFMVILYFLLPKYDRAHKGRPD